jgi:hypothetical protein
MKLLKTILILLIIASILSSATHGIANKDDIIENLTTDSIVIEREIIVNHSSGKTTVKLVSKPHEPLSDVSINELIPNCLGMNDEDIVFIGREPTRVTGRRVSWHFDYLKEPVTISYSANNLIEEECWHYFSVNAIGHRLGLKQEILAILFGSAFILMIVFFTLWHANRQDKIKQK